MDPTDRVARRVAAPTLLLVAGFVDAIAFVYLQANFVSFMSGNTTVLGTSSSMGNGRMRAHARPHRAVLPRRHRRVRRQPGRRATSTVVVVGGLRRTDRRCRRRDRRAAAWRSPGVSPVRGPSGCSWSLLPPA
ncbi:DUF1275 family protein [Gordonia sp. ABSL11-1]|uniref:DUF1275 family protein n=1 Tax=Gordonia sp. ABSL11-1 TaxID=3053924 RepID=UPI002572619F|nr:DUF1275 family protein [Gordonia sp. ABSL11-1]MDL9945311.1 DUF1275 family protein [Gordonia sp. ABSL11-1]